MNIWHFITFAGGAIAAKALALISLPIMLCCLSQSEVGFFALGNSFLAFLAALLGLGLRQLFAIDFVHLDEQARRTYVATVCSVYIVCAVFLCTVFFIFQRSIAQLFFAESVSRLLWIILIAQAFFSFFQEFFIQILIFNRQAAMATQYQLFFSAAPIAGTLVAVYWFPTGGAVLMSNAVCIVFVSLYAAYALRAWGFSWCMPRRHEIQDLVMRSFIFLPTTLAAWFLASSGRAFLAHAVQKSAVAIFSLAETFGTTMQLVILQPFANVFVPERLHLYVKGDVISRDRETKIFMVRGMGVLFVLVISGYFFCMPLARRFIPAAYQDAVFYALIFALGNIFLFGTYCATVLIQFLRHKIFLASIPLGLSLVQMVLGYPCARYGGIEGVVMLMVALQASHYVLTLFINHYLTATVVARDASVHDTTP